MQKIIKNWTFIDFSGEKIFTLFPDRLSELRTFDGNKFETVYSFDKLLNRKYLLANIKIDYEIYKEVVKLNKPEDLSPEAAKRWDFWTFYDNSSIIDEEINTINNYFLYKTKFGFAELYRNQRTKKENTYNWQRPDNYFFQGPVLHGINLETRIRLKHEILNILIKKGSKLTKNDGFLIFDYNRIKKIEYEKIDGQRGIYFKIIDGKVIVGGWDNPRDGGENYSSVEFLWYNTQSRLPKEFHHNMQNIIDALDEAIVHE